MKPTVKEIVSVLRWRAMKRNIKIMAPNIHLLMGEQDFLEVTPAGYAYEYEIKMSKADFANDFNKTACTVGRKRGHVPTKHEVLRGRANPWYETKGGNKMAFDLPRKFWFVCPEDLLQLQDVPQHCGLLWIAYDKRNHWWKVEEKRKAKVIKDSKKLSKAKLQQINTSISYRFWSQFDKIAELEQELKQTRSGA